MNYYSLLHLQFRNTKPTLTSMEDVLRNSPRCARSVSCARDTLDMITAGGQIYGSTLNGTLLDLYTPKDHLFLRELASPQRLRWRTLTPMSDASSHCEVIVVPKGWSCNKGGSGSERRAKHQRHIFNELACCLCVSVPCYFHMPKDSSLRP